MENQELTREIKGEKLTQKGEKLTQKGEVWVSLDRVKGRSDEYVE